MMTPFDEAPSRPAGSGPSPEPTPGAPIVIQQHDLDALGAPPPPAPESNLPENLIVSWSWVHLLIFLVFSFASLLIVQTALAIYYAGGRHLPQKELEKFLLSKPQFTLGSMMIWYATIFLFLYVTLAVLPNRPFWRSLGWRKIQRSASVSLTHPLIYFAAGCGLSMIVAIASARVQPPENAPIQELFKNRNTAMLFMAMAVLIAPLVEETIFRGYLYPLFARTFGMAPGIIITGVLFGAMHGTQLGWSGSLVAILVFVGVVFTYVRARTGTVLASYMLHLGYNSLIAVAAILGTHGFTKLPGQ